MALILLGSDTDAVQYTEEYIQKQLYYQAITILNNYASSSSSALSNVQDSIAKINSGSYFVYVFLTNSASASGLQAVSDRSYSSFFDGDTYGTCYVYVRILPITYAAYSSSSYDSFYNLYPSTSTTYTIYSYSQIESSVYYRQSINLSTNVSSYSRGTSSTSVYMPISFYGYMPDFFRDWCLNFGTSEADSIVESIEQQTESITDSIDEQTQQQQEQYEEFTSDEYDESEVDDTFESLMTSSDDVDDSEFTGFFESLFDLFYDNFCSVGFYEEFSINIPFTNDSITFESDMISSHIQDTYFYTFIELLYGVIFGLWGFRFAYGVICSIKDGTILDGDITSTGDEMLGELYGVKVNGSKKDKKEDKK